MYATIDARFEFSIDNHKMVPLAALGETFTEQNIENKILESLLTSLDARRGALW